MNGRRLLTGRLDLFLGKDGVVHHVRVVRPLGLGLDEAAQSTVKTWRFLPATKDGQPVAVEMNVEGGLSSVLIRFIAPLLLLRVPLRPLW
jgi:TonB family protein